MTLLDALVDVTLIDEDMKSILIDDANKEISSNMTMQVPPPGGQISYKCKWRHLVAEFSTNASGAIC